MTLDASLAACTTVTLELYAKHKGWQAARIRVSVDHRQNGAVYRMARTIRIDGHLSDEPRAAMLRVANACPVHKTLSREIAIDTSLGRAEP